MDEKAAKERRAARVEKRKSLAEADKQRAKAEQIAKLETARRINARVEATPRIIEGGR
ncbi:hypothetical protein [Roseovarius sp. D0-M9]|uniref:hypothetical protein n=1 Tax=Roseovarius sp. D0-M9 TaxID=3127117 RepID=UPI00300F8415